MLIHGDGNSNVVQDSMFNRAKWIENANINVVLMNPPYNATKNVAIQNIQRSGNQIKKKTHQRDFISLNGSVNMCPAIVKWLFYCPCSPLLVIQKK